MAGWDERVTQALVAGLLIGGHKFKITPLPPQYRNEVMLHLQFADRLELRITLERLAQAPTNGHQPEGG